MVRFTRDVGSKAFPHIAVAIALAAVPLTARFAQAHKPVTSNYTYNDDVFPIFRDRCGGCHVAGGPAPMSLLTYKDTLPWAESIREELTTEKMPPWYVDSLAPAVKGGQAISAREIDTIITWASGGTPEGDPGKKPAPVEFRPQWKAGPPDLKLEMVSEHTVAANKSEEMCEFTLPTGVTETKWIKLADLQPGTPSIVRDAVISIENGPDVAVWVPGNDGIAAPTGAAFRLPAGAKIHLQIHYQKPWQDEQNSKSDRSTVGLYFTDPPPLAGEIQALAIDSPAAAETQEGWTFSAPLAVAARVIAVRPTLDRPYKSVDVHAITPSGGRLPLLLLSAPRHEWRLRYWLESPVDLPPGSKLEVTATPTSPDPAVLPRPQDHRLQVSIDYTSL
jgi:mono/diheme cytochrome c family protein